MEAERKKRKRIKGKKIGSSGPVALYPTPKVSLSELKVKTEIDLKKS